MEEVALVAALDQGESSGLLPTGAEIGTFCSMRWKACWHLIDIVCHDEGHDLIARTDMITA